MPISAALGSSALSPAGLGFRNILINGDFAIDQRNAGASRNIGSTLTYTVDRWYGYSVGGMGGVGQRIAGSSPFQYNYRIYGGIGISSIGFGQRVEAANSFHLAGRTATLSGYFASSSLTSITWTLYYANTTDTFGTVASPTRTQIATGSFAINSTLTYKQVQIPVPTAATTGLELLFTTGAINGSNTVTFANIQLEANTQPTPFEQLPTGLELEICKRYYWRTGGTLYSPYLMLNDWSAGYGYGFMPLPISMRVAPTMSYSSLSHFRLYANGTIGTPTGIQLWTGGANNTDSYMFQIAGSAFGGGAKSAWMCNSDTASGWIDFSAEL